jgi:anaerobic selenocysteine-containing dehydrogenase
VQPLHESRSDLDIIFNLTQRLGLSEHFFDGDIKAAFNYQLAPAGVTVQQVREHPIGMRIDAPTHYQKYAAINPQTGQPRGFQTPTRKVEVYATKFARAGYPPLPAYEELAQTAESLTEVGV